MPPPNLTFRPGTPEDYAAALEIQYRAYREKEAPLYGPDIPPLAETPGTLAEEIAGGKTLFVAECDGRVVASLRMKRLDDGSAYFGRLSVDPSLQGRRIGQHMVDAFEKYNRDAPAFVLDCGVDSHENMHIYTKLGYRRTGESIHVPNGPTCVVMRKENRSSGTGE